MRVSLAGVRRRVDRARHHTLHHALGVALGIGTRAWHAILNPATPRLSLAELAAVQERFEALLARDIANVEAGYYPRELLFQLPLLDYARQLPEGLVDMPRVLARRHRSDHRDLPPGVDADQFPAYYLRNFHWQTDGWFSERSARIYDLSVEFLFLGTADMMRRMAIAPLAAGLDRPGARVLDMASGTGRFLMQLYRARPDLDLWALDLSSWYLAALRRNMRRIGAPGVRTLCENAEATTLPDGYFDAVTSVFLFHELPKDARRAVMREALRVLRPGGLFVVCDSGQLVDSMHLCTHLSAFPRLYHEPYYKGYLRDPLERAMAEVGFEDVTSEAHMVSKLVVGRRPE